MAEPAGTCYAWCLAKASWGYDEPGGILKRTETGWVVNWIRQNQWSSVLKLRIATFILRWRDNSEVAALAQEWRSTAERTQDRELLEAALYLLPSAEDTELQAWLADDELRAAALFLAVRMGQWPLVKIFWEEARRQFSFWDLEEGPACLAEHGFGRTGSPVGAPAGAGHTKFLGLMGANGATKGG